MTRDTYENPFINLHREFREQGADVLISSGQACVMYGIAAFSKDGDWVVRETAGDFNAVLTVLEGKKAVYRFGAPLDVRWHRKGWTSHFEFINNDGNRIRVDFCSRPPRIKDIARLWKNAVHKQGYDLVDVQSLIKIKQSRRVRDYPIIGSIAEMGGLENNEPEIALNYLQDYDSLKVAVLRWPAQAAQCHREAVALLQKKAARDKVVSALATEQDKLIVEDDRRIKKMVLKLRDFHEIFFGLKALWEKEMTPLRQQHEQLLGKATGLLTKP